MIGAAVAVSGGGAFAADAIATMAENLGDVAKFPDAKEGAPTEWASKISLGADMKSGNTESDAFSGRVETEKFFGRTLLMSYVEGAYEETETKDSEGVKTKNTTTGNVRANLNVKRRFDGLFVFGDVSLLHDDVADVKLRGIESVGVGTFLIDSATTRFFVEGGLAYVHERTSEDDEYFALRFAERFDWQFSDTVKLWELVEAIPEIKDFGNVLITAEAGLETKITERLALSVKYRLLYDAEPSGGAEHTDRVFSTQLSLTF